MIVIIVLGLLITTDILLVSKAGVGPFLAIRTKVYDDGGTKEYYGLGYKVIKYNQEIGRRDTVLGSWFYRSMILIQKALLLQILLILLSMIIIIISENL